MILSSSLLRLLVGMDFIYLLNMLQLIILLLLHIDHVVALIELLLLLAVGSLLDGLLLVLFILIRYQHDFYLVRILLLFVVLLKQLLFKLLILPGDLFLHQFILINLILILCASWHLNCLHDAGWCASSWNGNCWSVLDLGRWPICSNLIACSQWRLIKWLHLSLSRFTHCRYWRWRRIKCRRLRWRSCYSSLSIVSRWISSHRSICISWILRLWCLVLIRIILIYCSTNDIHFIFKLW